MWQHALAEPVQGNELPVRLKEIIFSVFCSVREHLSTEKMGRLCRGRRSSHSVCCEECHEGQSVGLENLGSNSHDLTEENCSRERDLQLCHSKTYIRADQMAQQ